MRFEISCFLEISKAINERAEERFLGSSRPLGLDVALVDLDSLPLEQGEHALARGGAARAFATSHCGHVQELL